MWDEFALDDHGAGADDEPRRVEDHEDVVGVVAGGDEVVAGVEGGGRGGADEGEDAECVEEACAQERGVVSGRCVRDEQTRPGGPVDAGTATWEHTVMEVAPPQWTYGVSFG